MKRPTRPVASSDAPIRRVHTPHDAFFKVIFQDPEQAIAEFRAVLPASVSDDIDWSTLTRHPGSYIDPDLWQRHADLVFSATLKGTGDEAVLYFLFEHQSTPDARMTARMWIYLARMVEDWMRAHPGEPTVPAVVPVLLAHGPEGWTTSTELIDVFNLPQAAKARWSAVLPKMTVIIDDLAQHSDDQIRARQAATAVSQLAWLLLKHAPYRDDVLDLLSSWSQDVVAVLTSPGGHERLHVMFRYLLEVSPYATVEDLASVADTMKSTHTKAIQEAAMTAGQQLIQQGRQTGMLQERSQAILDALEARGIPVEDDVRKRILSATDLDTLKRWFRRAVTVAKASAIFTAEPS